MTATTLIIVITVTVSLVALYLRPGLLDRGMLRPYRVMREKSWHELLTSGFLHAGMAHLFVNMFVLFFFGIELESVIGPGELVLLYLSGIVVSSLPSLIKFADDPNYATLGASGAVGSVLFGFILLFPDERLILILFPVPMPAWIFGLLYLAYSIYESNRRRGKVNHEAHIAGALWGMLYLLLFVPDSGSRFWAFFG